MICLPWWVGAGLVSKKPGVFGTAIFDCEKAMATLNSDYRQQITSNFSRSRELELRCHLDAEVDPGKGTTRTVSELAVFSGCLPGWFASSMSRFKTS